ncbi:MAG: phycobilisome linker polypeptide [Cyanobacteria bacterium J06598_3]
MTGMNVLGNAEISDYQGRTVTIGVTGVCQQSVLKTGSYQVKVPFSQMSQVMQTINRQGGKVASVQITGSPPVTSGAQAQAPATKDSGNQVPTKTKSSKRKRR